VTPSGMLQPVVDTLLEGRPQMRGRRRVGRLIERYFGSFRKSQRKTMAALAVGLLQSGVLGLATIARGMADRTEVRHRIKRIWRFCRNEGVSIEKATEALVAWAVRGMDEVVVALDWTYLGDYVMLCASAVVGRRAAPLAWTVMHKGRFEKDRKSRNDVEEKLLLRLRGALGKHRWVLVADRGFARADLAAKLSGWGVRFVIRACGGTWVEGSGLRGVLDNVPRPARRMRRYEEVLYHRTRRVPVSLVVSHAEPAAEPWYLVTNVEGLKEVVALYRKRMWIVAPKVCLARRGSVRRAEGFRDLKSGLGLKKLWLATTARIERLFIIAAVVMLLSLLTALEWMSRCGERDPQLSTKRRGGALSLFRCGLELIRLLGIPPQLHRTRLRLASDAI
jgi:hypothetical protein